MAMSGEICDKSGIYTPDCGHQSNTIVVAQGERLPPCPRCKAPVSWTRTYPVTDEWTVARHPPAARAH